MSIQDPISDMLTSIRNAHARNKSTVVTPDSKIKVSILAVLKAEGYITNYSVTEGTKRSIQIELKYYNENPVIEMIKRVSKPSLRVFKKVNELPKVLDGLGIAIVSTSKGVMTDRAARQVGEGGEVICYVA